MIETLLLFQLITVVAFVPTSDGGYAEWDIEVTSDEFTAIKDDKYFTVVGYSPNQFTHQMLRVWDFERS